MNIFLKHTHATVVRKEELWDVFAKSGDIEFYSMYLTLKEEDMELKKKKNANSRH